MAIAKGVRKQLAYKLETAWGTLAGTSGGKLLRRVTAQFKLDKEAYESQEIRTDLQVGDYRHGIRSASGSINGELSPGTYSELMQSVLYRDFAAITSITGLSLTVAPSGNNWTITRSAGSWIADNITPGSIVRITAGSFNALNLNKNLLVLSETATVLTVSVLNGTALFAEGPIASATVALPGKRTFVPSTGHTDQSFTVEEWFPDAPQSEVYTGVKFSNMQVQLPTSGLVTVNFNAQGKDLTSTGSTQYFTAPTALNTNGIFASAQGAVTVNGVLAGLVTSADFTVERALENATVIGSNSIADIFTGKVRVTGNMSVYFDSATFRDLFANETIASVSFVVTTSSGANADFVSFTLPKIKFGGFDKADAELGIMASMPFTALLNDVTSGGHLASTIVVQDSQA